MLPGGILPGQQACMRVDNRHAWDIRLRCRRQTRVGLCAYQACTCVMTRALVGWLASMIYELVLSNQETHGVDWSGRHKVAHKLHRLTVAGSRTEQAIATMHGPSKKRLSGLIFKRPGATGPDACCNMI
jgi:hypothetical protein